MRIKYSVCSKPKCQYKNLHLIFEGLSYMAQNASAVLTKELFDSMCDEMTDEVFYQCRFCEDPILRRKYV